MEKHRQLFQPAPIMPLHHHQYFSDKSDLYAQARPKYPAPLFRYLAEQSRETTRAWDCGTGSGQAAVALADYFRAVDATDVSREQIANATPHPRVTYAVQPAEATGFPDAAFDLITVAQALHWFDLDKFWPEVRRTLKPGGIFAAWAYGWPHISPAVDAVLQRELLDPIRPYWAEQNRLVWSGYRDIPFPFDELAVPRIEMTLQWNLAELLAYLGTWSATRCYVEANGAGVLDHLSANITVAWGDTDARKPVLMDFYLRAGRQ